MHDDIDEGDSTLHLLCHGSSRDASKMREYFGTFFKEHLEFLLQIACDILSQKKQPINDYINYILSESQPLDEIRILLCKDVPLAYCHHYGHDVLDNLLGP